MLNLIMTANPGRIVQLLMIMVLCAPVAVMADTAAERVRLAEMLNLPEQSQVAPLRQSLSVDRWLDKMSQASRLQNYRGTLIIRQQDRLQAIRVNQGVTEEGSWQTLQSLSGEAQNIFRQNDQVTSIFPAKKLVTISGDSALAPLHPILPQNRRILTRYYSLSLGGQDRVANKLAQIIEMKPLDGHRYGYVFWLDQETGLLLKCDLMDTQGNILEQLMYSELELLDEAPQLPLDVQHLQGYTTLNLRKHHQPVAASWQAAQLPDGFMLKRSMRFTAPGRQQSHHLVYTDGMASVSVFVETEKPAQAVQGPSRMGPVNAFSALRGGAFVTAIGEVPGVTVQMIAESMQVESND